MNKEKKVTLEFIFDEDELVEFVENHGTINDFIFGELCQNWNFGFLTQVLVEDNDT